MVLPTLVHPVPVTIQRQLAGSTLFDDVARQPVRQLWKQGQAPGLADATELEAQVNFNNEGKIGEPMLDPGGVRLESTGYLLFRLVDLLDAGVATDNGDGTIDVGLKRGDLITRIGNRRTKYYIVWFRDVAFYTDQAGATLLEVQFHDRLPADGS